MPRPDYVLDLISQDGVEGPIIVDMTVDASTDPPTYGGTITVNGEVIHVSEAQEES